MKIWILTNGTKWVRQSSVSAYVRKRDALEAAANTMGVWRGADEGDLWNVVNSGPDTPYQLGQNGIAWETSDRLQWMTLCCVIIGGNQHGDAK